MNTPEIIAAHTAGTIWFLSTVGLLVGLSFLSEVFKWSYPRWAHHLLTLGVVIAAIFWENRW